MTVVSIITIQNIDGINVVEEMFLRVGAEDVGDSGVKA